MSREQRLQNAKNALGEKVINLKISLATAQERLSETETEKRELQKRVATLTGGVARLARANDQLVAMAHR